MVTSDRIAVMNLGRIVQVGQPDEIFERPKSRFVAEFIGKTNILSGKLADSRSVVLGDGLRLQVAGGDGFRPGSEVGVCIRPHSLALVAGASEAEEERRRGNNLFSGVIQRRIYFGDAIDYTVELPAQRLSLRVVAPPSCRYEPGQKIFALAHPDHCVLIGD